MDPTLLIVILVGAFLLLRPRARFGGSTVTPRQSLEEGAPYAPPPADVPPGYRKTAYGVAKDDGWSNAIATGPEGPDGRRVHVIPPAGVSASPGAPPATTSGWRPRPPEQYAPTPGSPGPSAPTVRPTAPTSTKPTPPTQRQTTARTIAVNNTKSARNMPSFILGALKR
jgi:hypothetical protein